MNSVSLPQHWAPSPATGADVHGRAPAPRARGAAGALPSGTSWRLHRRCALTPAQLAGCGAVVALVSLTIGFGFWAIGARYVLWFAGAETVAVVLALLVHAVHAVDGERLELRGQALFVEQRAGWRTRHWVLDARRLRFSLADAGGVRIDGGLDAALVVGRHVRAETWTGVVTELQHACAQLRAG